MLVVTFSVDNYLESFRASPAFSSGHDIGFGIARLQRRRGAPGGIDGFNLFVRCIIRAITVRVA
jgi:hypothetical protein